VFQDTNEESRFAWEENADFWDSRMGDESNDFHRTIVRPHTEELLNVVPGDLILDIACGTGNFSQRMAEKGARVVAFDYSEKMIGHARRRRAAFLDRISFRVCDATSHDALLALRQAEPFDKAVANMAVMDISDVEPLFRAVFDLLRRGGSFVFSAHHPCFVRPGDRYRTACVYRGEAIAGQPVLQNYYHRSLQELFSRAFRLGFVLDGFYEEGGGEYPAIFIARLRKPEEFAG